LQFCRYWSSKTRHTGWILELYLWTLPTKYQKIYLFVVLYSVCKTTHRISIRINFVLRFILPSIIRSLPYNSLTHKITIHIMIEFILRMNIAFDLNKIVIHLSTLRLEIGLNIDNIFGTVFDSNENIIFTVRHSIYFSKNLSLSNVMSMELILWILFDFSVIAHNIQTGHSILILVSFVTILIPGVCLSIARIAACFNQTYFYKTAIRHSICYVWALNRNWKAVVWRRTLFEWRLQFLWSICSVKNKYVLSI